LDPGGTFTGPKKAPAGGRDRGASKSRKPRIHDGQNAQGSAAVVPKAIDSARAIRDVNTPGMLPRRSSAYAAWMAVWSSGTRPTATAPKRHSSAGGGVRRDGYLEIESEGFLATIQHPPGRCQIRLWAPLGKMRPVAHGVGHCASVCRARRPKSRDEELGTCRDKKAYFEGPKLSPVGNCANAMQELTWPEKDSTFDITR